MINEVIKIKYDIAINADIIPHLAFTEISRWGLVVGHDTVKKYGSRLFELLQQNTGATSDARRVLKSF